MFEVTLETAREERPIFAAIGNEDPDFSSAGHPQDPVYQPGPLGSVTPALSQPPALPEGATPRQSRIRSIQCDSQNCTCWEFPPRVPPNSRQIRFLRV